MRLALVVVPDPSAAPRKSGSKTQQPSHLVRFENAALRIDERNACAIEYKAVSKSACLYSATARGRELGDGVECRLSDLDVQRPTPASAVGSVNGPSRGRGAMGETRRKASLGDR